MFLYTVSVAAAIFILIIVGFRLIIHFHFCRRVSARYPGEKLKGCPIWTHSNSNGGMKGNDVNRQEAALEGLHNMSNNLEKGAGEEKKLDGNNQCPLSFQQNGEDYQAIPV